MTKKPYKFCLMLLSLIIGFGPFLVAQDLEIVAIRGQTAPGTDEEFLAFRRAVELDSDGDVSFITTLENGCLFCSSIYSQRNGALEPLIIFEDLLPGGISSARIDEFKINNAGDFFFTESLMVSNDLLVRGSREGTFEILFQDGDILPGSSGLPFSRLALGGVNEITEDGSVAFFAIRCSGSCTAVETGIWLDRNDGNGLNAVLVTEEDDDDGGQEVGPVQGIRDWDVNNNNVFAAVVDLWDLTRSRVIRTDANGNEQFVFEPDAGTGVSGLRINESGQIAFILTPPQSSPENWEFWSEAFGGTLVRILSEGDPAPGLEGVSFGELRFLNAGQNLELELNNQGQSLFFSMLSGMEVDDSNNEAIWKHSARDSVELVARKGDPAPGTQLFFGDLGIGSTFTEGRTVFNHKGQVAFIATVNDGVQESHGVWAEDLSGELQLIAIDGQQIDVDPGPGIELEELCVLGAEQEIELNDRGQIAFFAELPSSGNIPNVVLLSNAVAEQIVGDVNGDSIVNLLDVEPFVSRISNGNFSVEADINGDGAVNLLDVAPFVELLSGG